MRTKKSSYWVGVIPSGVNCQEGLSQAMQITEPTTLDAVFRLYRRHAKHYNDIELDRSSDISKQQYYCNATVLTVNERFVVASRDESGYHWILEVTFRRGFSSFDSEKILNTLRSVCDIKGLYLHYNTGGPNMFEEWLLKEKQESHGKGEWVKYNKVEFFA